MTSSIFCGSQQGGKNHNLSSMMMGEERKVKVEIDIDGFVWM